MDIDESVTIAETYPLPQAERDSWLRQGVTIPDEDVEPTPVSREDATTLPEEARWEAMVRILIEPILRAKDSEIATQWEIIEELRRRAETAERERDELRRALAPRRRPPLPHLMSPTG